MKIFWRKSGDDDYICELREKKKQRRTAYLEPWTTEKALFNTKKNRTEQRRARRKNVYRFLTLIRGDKSSRSLLYFWKDP